MRSLEMQKGVTWWGRVLKWRSMREVVCAIDSGATSVLLRHRGLDLVWEGILGEVGG